MPRKETSEEQRPDGFYAARVETDLLRVDGFTQEEVMALLWLRSWYQSGGSDRAEIVRHLEFIRLLVASGKLTP